MDTNFSVSPLAKKPGIKSGMTIKLVGQPSCYFDLFNDQSVDIVVQYDPLILKDFILFFIKDKTEFEATLRSLKNEIKQNGVIWVSWPKKLSKVETAMSKDIVRKTAIRNGLVDVKVCSVDDTWSALKLVIPVKDRK
ncbi:MAG: DUF3052 family protein [Saprospiraceae bacterium]|nr:DUF3052 family protein [Saprospiraceae bacterium]